MAYTYEWKIDKIFTKRQHGTLRDVVSKIEWHVTGTDSDGYTGDHYGATSFRDRHIDSNNISPLSSLTEEQMVNWIRVTDTYMDLINTEIKKEIKEQRLSDDEKESEIDLPWN